ncbi:MAG TPA: penicillin-binding transpeptidase domain-containing protein, partial [Candidatus Paceibacterota bacterium]|nr:penicillin-binding transpeptidase domain-containing protein [Candidatus Paceibacterota bacterium]
GAIMDIRTGEILALTSYPEYNQTILADGTDTATIKGYLTSSSRPFLNRATEGLYTPGSIIKPFLALAALQEKVISPTKIIVTTGELRVPNPFAPGQFSIFKDNAVHGPVDMRKAIAVSSNVYFYEIGGGFENQPGLGINNIEKYAELFGIGEKTGIDLSGEVEGTIPSIEWKAQHFPGDPWRVGDTYNTSIGQYGFQVTPIQMLRAVAGIASRGTLVTPTILKSDGSHPVQKTTLPFEDSYYTVVHDAMRDVVTSGTATVLDIPEISVAAKTGTAQIKNNTRVNSWVIGFFPTDHPRYAFTVLMEDGPKVSVGATHAFRSVLDFLTQNPDVLPLYQ